MTCISRFALLLFSVATTLAAANQVLAQSFPQRPIRLIVPFAAGGNSDLVARSVAQHWTDSLGQQIVVENKGGAFGSIGAEQVQKSAPDGYTLLLLSSSTSTAGRPSSQFSPIGMLCLSPIALLASSQTYAQMQNQKQFQDLVAFSRKRPLNIGTVGLQPILEQVIKLGGLQGLPIPYKYSGELGTAIISGQIDLAVVTLDRNHLAQHDMGRLRLLGTFSERQVIAGIPALGNSGLRMEAFSAYGVVAPSQTPTSIVSLLANSLVKANAAAAGTFEKALLIPRPMGPAEYGSYLTTYALCPNCVPNSGEACRECTCGNPPNCSDSTSKCYDCCCKKN